MITTPEKPPKLFIVFKLVTINIGIVPKIVVQLNYFKVYCNKFPLQGAEGLRMIALKYCIPVIPSVDLEKSLRFWVDGLGLTADQHMWQDGRLVGCMVHNHQLFFWLNQRAGQTIPAGYEGIRLYWTAADLSATREHLLSIGYNPSEIEARDYGQTEFVLCDDDGYSHCFAVATNT